MWLVFLLCAVFLLKPDSTVVKHTSRFSTYINVFTVVSILLIYEEHSMITYSR